MNGLSNAKSHLGFLSVTCVLETEYEVHVLIRSYTYNISISVHVVDDTNLYLQKANLHNVVLNILRGPVVICFCNANDTIMLRFSNVSLPALILITNVNNCEMKICYFEKIMDRNETINLSCWQQVEEKWSQDGKDFFIFLVLFHLLQ